MPTKLFISYANADENKLRAFLRALRNANGEIVPIVVADRRSPGTPLADKVKDGIREASHFVPILTHASIHNQWVNQEIGFAEASGKNIIPLVEKSIVPTLKGFVHSQNDFPSHLRQIL